MTDKKKQALPGASAKVYDGSRIVPHTVQGGQSLSKIAEIYQFRSWKPIWTYNAKIYATIDDDPAFIREGITILIPRSVKGYEDMIKRLERSKIIAQGHGEALLYELEAQQYQTEAWKIGVDFAADVLTTVASLGLKAAAAAKATKAIAGAKTQAKIAQHLSANATTREFAHKFALLRNKNTATALKANAAKFAAAADIRKSIGQKAIGAAADLADVASQKLTGDEDSSRFSNTFKAMLTAESAMEARKAWKAAQNVLNSTIDVAGIALDYLKPSQLAEFYLFATAGETSETSRNNARKNIIASVDRSIEMLNASIDRYAKEKDLLYT